jgi:TolB-like protein/tetratricopeptide (TPR) repeat protein
MPARRERMPATVATAVVLAVLTLSAALVGGPSPGSPRVRDAATLDPGRIVVAPLTNRSSDPALDALAELASEEITRGLELTEVIDIADPGVKPPDRPREVAHALPPGEEAVAARALAFATGSGLAVWGSVTRRGDQIEIAAHMVDERNGRILRTLEPVLGDTAEPRPALRVLRDRLMAVLAEAVDPRLGASASTAGEPPRYDAYLEFSTGVGIWYDQRNGRAALPHFARAAELDSTFALPLIWAAWVHQTLDQCDSTETIARRLAAMHLTQLERLQTERQTDRCRGDLAAAYRTAHLLADARPRSEVWAEQLARDALDFERPRETVEVLERLHPDRGALRGRVSYYNWLTNAYHLLGDHERELQAAVRARRQFPANLAALRMELVARAALGQGRVVTDQLSVIDALPPDPIRRKATVMREIALDLAAHGDSVAARAAFSSTLRWLASRPTAERTTEYMRFERARTLEAAGFRDSARAAVEPLARSHPGIEDYLGLVGVLAAQRGDTAEAVRTDAVLESLEGARRRGRASYWRACIAARRGQREAAVDLLGRALSDGYVFNGLFFLSAHLEPSFAVLRGYAPFEELLRPKG